MSRFKEPDDAEGGLAAPGDEAGSNGTAGRTGGPRNRRPPSPPERVYTIREIADLLQTHPRTVTRIIDSGALRAARLSPRVLRVTERAYREYLSRSEEF